MCMFIHAKITAKAFMLFQQLGNFMFMYPAIQIPTHTAAPKIQMSEENY